MGAPDFQGGIPAAPNPCDVSDEEWALVAPYLTLLPETAAQREHSLRGGFNGLATWCGTAWRGARCPTICCPGTLSTVRPSAGCGQAASRTWSTTYAPYCAWLRVAPRNPPPWCSTAGRCTRHPRAVLAPPGTDTRHPRLEVARGGRYARSDAGAACHTGQRR